MQYLNHLHTLVKEGGLSITEDFVKEYSREDSRYNVKNSSLYFRTESLEVLRPLADMFLDESGKKRIPSNIAEHLTERSLAFWIMDDGQRVKRGGVTLCTDSFKSNEISVEALKLNFNFTTSIHNKKNCGANDSIYERIYINKETLDSLKPNLIPHIHDTMLYKVNSEVVLKQDTSDFLIESGSDVDIDIFDI